MKTTIKTFLSTVLVLVAVAVSSSCNKEEQQSYPSHLSGTWVNRNASSGYTTTLEIKDISDGQYAYFTMMSPAKEETLSSKGSFIYDSATGKGNISTNMVGSATVTVYAALSTDSYLDATAKRVVSGGVETLFQGTLNKVEE